MNTFIHLSEGPFTFQSSTAACSNDMATPVSLENTSLFNNSVLP